MWIAIIKYGEVIHDKLRSNCTLILFSQIIKIFTLSNFFLTTTFLIRFLFCSLIKVNIKIKLLQLFVMFNMIFSILNPFAISNPSFSSSFFFYTPLLSLMCIFKRFFFSHSLLLPLLCTLRRARAKIFYSWLRQHWLYNIMGVGSHSLLPTLPPILPLMCLSHGYLEGLYGFCFCKTWLC